MFTGIPAAAQPGGRVLSWSLRLLVVAGIVAIAVGWAQASDTVQVSDQVDWAPVGLAGAAAVTAALVGSVLVARQAVAIRLGHLAPYIAEPSDPVRVRGGAVKSVGGGADEPLVAAGSMARFHRASCPLTSGKPVRPESRQAHEQAGRRPCGVCTP